MALARSNLSLLRPVDRPAALAGGVFQIGIRIHGKWMARELQHGGVVHGIAEDRVNLIAHELANGNGFAFSTRNVHELVRRDAIVADHARAEHVIGGKTKLTDAV